MKLHTGDLVVIIAGKDKGKTGRILRVLENKNRVVVAGANMRTRHMRKTPQAPGRIVHYEAALSVSNVMIVDPKTKKRSRIGFEVKNGKKKRIAKNSGEELVTGRRLRKAIDEEGNDDEKKEEKIEKKTTTKKKKASPKKDK